MKSLLIFLFLSLSIGVVQGQSKADDLKKLFEVMQTEKLVDGVFDQMMPYFRDQALREIGDTDQQDDVNSFMDFVMKEAKGITKKLINNDMLPLYDKHFTQQEIKDMIVFYESPTGKKMLEKMPALTTEMMTIMSEQYMPDFEEKMMKKLEKMIE